MNYYELAQSVGDMVRMNNIIEVDENLFDNVENGILYNDEYPDEVTEIYQFYAITEGGADYLKEYTDEVVFYSDKLDAYFWGITHFGTAWNGVEVNTLKETVNQ